MGERHEAALPIFLLGVFVGAVLFGWIAIGFSLKPSAHGGSDIQMTYPDLAALLLGGVAVMVTVLGVFVAILAIWGYVHFKRTTKAAALTYIKNELQDGSIRGKLEELVLEHIADEVSKPDGQLRSLLIERLDAIILNNAQERAHVQPDDEFKE